MMVILSMFIFLGNMSSQKSQISLRESNLSIIHETAPVMQQKPFTKKTTDQRSPKALIDDTFNTLENHFKRVMDRLENATGNYIPLDDDDKPDLGIWDPRYNVERVKKPFPKARSTLKFLASMTKVTQK